jgi:adenylosuccinate lyase
MGRDEAYAVVQRLAMRIWDGAGSLRDLLVADPEAGRRLPATELDRIFAAESYLKNVDRIYDRVLGKAGEGR